MHEYSIVQALVDRVEVEVRSRGACRVQCLAVSIGELSGVETALLATAYDTFRAGTVCATACLEMTTVPAQWECRRCGRDLARGEILTCPFCGAAGVLRQGDEILLERIEMEVPDV